MSELMAGDRVPPRGSRKPRHVGALRRSPNLSTLRRPCVADPLVLGCAFESAGMELGAVVAIIIESAHALGGIAQLAGHRLHLVHGMSTAAMGSASLLRLEAAAMMTWREGDGLRLVACPAWVTGAATTPRRRPPAAASGDEGAPRTRSIFGTIGRAVAG